MVKQYQDTGSGTAPTAPTLYEYDSFGNVVKQTLALTSPPTPQNSPIVELSYSVESTDEGVFSVMTQTHYNATGHPLQQVQKSLISGLSATLESKNLTIDERNLTSTQWVEYHVGTKRTLYNSLPMSDITAEAVSVDAFVLSQTDNAGVITTSPSLIYYNYRHYNPGDGRWIRRDIIVSSNNQYSIIENRGVFIDYLGLEYIDYKIVLIPTGGICGTICAKDLNNKGLAPKVLVEKWIMPSWWEIAKAPRKEEEQWREMTQEEMYIYLSEDNGRVIVERNAETLFARALEIKYIFNGRLVERVLQSRNI